ncbi:hypothetical protein [Nitrosomonas oligotropha]|uniref:Uncharacterized protein n=1 Tax=Nitrosomonas oligotropha TaxID=42354 RepID=A0A1H8V5U9_9PROT|nr:hypothetical protein [Nitrosomonas oligotropha]SDX54460.1 hypothetical protein SAMN05216300_14812 [Nitrosomonas oligotropha]SEP10785.1 hypothetical protein SAMN05216333_14612 [Nitrosomonas oligotropha]
MTIKLDELRFLGKTVKTRNKNDIVLMTMSAGSIVAILEVIAAIGSAMNKKEAERVELEWQEEVSNKLNMILAVTAEILRELKNLRLHIDESIEKGFRQDVEIELKALCNQYFDIVNNKKLKVIIKDKEAKKLISDLAIKLHLLVYKLMGYGFVGFTVVATGVCTYLSMQIYLKAANESFLNNVINWFISGGDPKYSGSFANVRDILNNEAMQAKNSISTFPSKGLVGYDTYYVCDDPNVFTSNIYVRNDDLISSFLFRGCSSKTYYYDVYEGTVIGDINTGLSVTTNKIDDTFTSKNPNNLPEFPGFPPRTELNSTRQYNAYANEIGKWLNDKSIIFREATNKSEQLNSYAELSVKIGSEFKKMTKK